MSTWTFRLGSNIFFLILPKDTDPNEALIDLEVALRQGERFTMTEDILVSRAYDMGLEKALAVLQPWVSEIQFTNIKKAIQEAKLCAGCSSSSPSVSSSPTSGPISDEVNQPEGRCGPVESAAGTNGSSSR